MYQNCFQQNSCIKFNDPWKDILLDCWRALNNYILFFHAFSFSSEFTNRLSRKKKKINKRIQKKNVTHWIHIFWLWYTFVYSALYSSFGWIISTAFQSNMQNFNGKVLNVTFLVTTFFLQNKKKCHKKQNSLIIQFNKGALFELWFTMLLYYLYGFKLFDVKHEIFC